MAVFLDIECRRCGNHDKEETCITTFFYTENASLNALFDVDRTKCVSENIKVVDECDSIACEDVV